MKCNEWIQPVAGALLMLAAIGTLVALVCSQYQRVPPETLSLPPPPEAAATAQMSSLSKHRGPGDVGVTVSAMTPRIRSIYRCVQSGVQTYSENPCGNPSQVTQIDPRSLNTYHAPPLPAIAEERRPAYTDAPAAPGLEGLALGQAMREVEAAPRHPYQEPRGNALCAQLHSVSGAYYDPGCTV